MNEVKVAPPNIDYQLSSLDRAVSVLTRHTARHPPDPFRTPSGPPPDPLRTPSGLSLGSCSLPCLRVGLGSASW
eukprot:645307-Prorocentrum_minimum.AAC.1